ncbi:MAG: hypothetical protein FIB08_12130 [Candidatus Methanoperedens sp.]|nr:hypothetical protein [Candidatus Methanoperedens sp.]
MSWIEKIFGKKQQQASPEIKFGELGAWLDAESGKLSEKLGSYAASLYPDIREVLSEIRKSASILEKADPEGRFHLRQVKIGTSNRDNMVKQVRMLIDNISIPKTTDVKSIILFHDNAMQSLRVCLENMLKSHQYVKQVFLEESKQVIGDVNELGRLLNKLIEPIRDRKAVLDAFDNAKNTLSDLGKLYSDIEIEKKTIKENEENISGLKMEIGENEKALAGLKGGQQWKQYLEQKDELILLENKARQAESDINALVLPLNKVLNRLRQLSESGRYILRPEIREELHSCLSAPGSASLEFFTEVKSIIESGALNLEPEKKEKMLEQINFIISSFGENKGRYESLVTGIEMKKEEISNMAVHQEEKLLENKVSSLQDKLSTSEKELEASKKHLSSFLGEVESKKQELQQSVSIIDSRMKVIF